MLTHFRETLRPALVLLALFTALTGNAYPLAITGAAQLALRWQANGSLIRQGGPGGRVVGSALVGQSFTAAGYFHGRPSAAGKGYDAANSGASNYAPGAPELRQRIAGDIANLRKAGLTSREVPADLVTTSASGLDPDISPEAAFLQVGRVAQARGLAPDTVRMLVAGEVRQPPIGFLGAPHVNVLALNLALDVLAHRQKAPSPAKLPV